MQPVMKHNFAKIKTYLKSCQLTTPFHLIFFAVYDGL